jgi:hypothetical protein
MQKGVLKEILRMLQDDVKWIKWNLWSRICVYTVDGVEVFTC